MLTPAVAVMEGRRCVYYTHARLAAFPLPYNGLKIDVFAHHPSYNWSKWLGVQSC